MKRIIIIIVILFFIAGCATTPMKEPVSFKGAAYSINGASYIPANTIIQTCATRQSWDPVARKLTLSKNNKEAVFCVGTSTALIDRIPKKLTHPVKMHAGQVVIPANFARSELKRLFLPRPVVRKKRRKVHKGKYAIRRIVIDPGHGGKDPGAISPTGIREKNIVLSVAKKLRKYLENEGIEVILTRDRDRFISLWRRSNIANKKNADFFISVHANAARTKYANGIEVFYLSERADSAARATAAAENAALQYEKSSFDGFKPKTAVAATLGDMLNAENRAESIELAECITKGMCKALNARNRGVKGARFYVLKGAQVPAVLIEVGFLSNRKEAAKLKRNDYQTKLAKAIANGIFIYKQRYERTDGFTR